MTNPFSKMMKSSAMNVNPYMACPECFQWVKVRGIRNYYDTVHPGKSLPKFQSKSNISKPLSTNKRDCFCNLTHRNSSIIRWRFAPKDDHQFLILFLNLTNCHIKRAKTAVKIRLLFFRVDVSISFVFNRVFDVSICKGTWSIEYRSLSAYMT